LNGDDHRKINADRRDLHRKILTWRKQQAEFVPAVKDSDGDPPTEDSDELETEKICLHLPSYFSAHERRRLNLTSLASIELKLRKGEANDALQDLRTQINFILGLEVQKRGIRYTKNLTRAAKIMQDAGRARDAIADSYRAARAAIVALGGDGVVEYPSLSAQDMRIKSIKGGRDPNQKGKETEGWVFKKVARLAGCTKTQEEWDKEGKRALLPLQSLR
jgi:hypothetical protein